VFSAGLGSLCIGLEREREKGLKTGQGPQIKSEKVGKVKNNL